MNAIKLKDIIPPEDYIRGHYDRARVEDFVRIGAGLGPTDKIPKAKDGSAITWPFPPIVVVKTEVQKQKPDKPLKGGAKVKTKKGSVKVLTRYEIIDGVHRWQAARKLGLTEIAASVHTAKDAGEKFLAQYNASAIGNLPLDPIQRAQAIWKMAVVYKIPQTKICEITKMHKSSISRIVSKKQGWERPGRASANYGSGSSKSQTGQGSAPAGLVYTGAMLFDRLLDLCDEYKKGGAYYPEYFATQKDNPGIKIIQETAREISNFIGGLK